MITTHKINEITVAGEMDEWLNMDIYLMDVEGQDPGIALAVSTYIQEVFLFQKATGQTISEWLGENHPEVFTQVGAGLLINVK